MNDASARAIYSSILHRRDFDLWNGLVGLYV